MRLYYLLNFQHVLLSLFPTLVFVILFGLALGYGHFSNSNSELRMKEIISVFPEGIEDRNAPFPLVLILIIAGTVIWGLFYILITGLMEVRI